MFEEFFNWIKRNKEGIILGAIAGTIYASTLKDVGFALQTQSAIDPFIESTKNFAMNKVRIAMGFLGAFVGGEIQEFLRRVT